MIHVDVMDGHFVPPITIGPLVVGAIADQVHDAGGALDVHLMIEHPERQIDEFVKAGADTITFHAEADPHVHRTLSAIREAGCLRRPAAQPGHPGRGDRRVRGRRRPRALHERQPRLGRPVLHPRLARQGRAAGALVGAAAIEVDGGVDAGTAGGSPPLAPAFSSPAPPSSERMIRPRPTQR